MARAPKPSAPKNTTKALSGIALVLVALAVLYDRYGAGSGTTTSGSPPATSAPSRPAASGSTTTSDGDLERIARAFQAKQSDLIVTAAGDVVHLLPDDNEGARHQVFLVELKNGITLKLAHNLDLSTRVPIANGDRIEFQGEYEWNVKGGVIHWTHRDPAGRHADGWLKHAGKTYQ
jgi:hypothetical protein